MNNNFGAQFNSALAGQQQGINPFGGASSPNQGLSVSALPMNGINQLPNQLPQAPRPMNIPPGIPAGLSGLPPGIIPQGQPQMQRPQMPQGQGQVMGQPNPMMNNNIDPRMLAALGVK